MSERDNWNHLYMTDRQSGKVKHQITKGQWYVRDIIHVDEKARLIYFSANGMVDDEDPYFIRFYRIKMDGTELTCLTPEEGTHTAWFSKDFNFFVDTWSKVDMAPTTVLRNTKDGQVVMPLEECDLTA